MRAILIVAAAMTIVGVTGAWSLWAAASEYTSTLRTYTRLDVVYQPDSFVWLEPDYSRARATILVVNDSPVDATLRWLDLHLRFDGAFAGSNYDPIAPVAVPSGESRTLDVVFDVTTPSIQSQGGTATLSLSGQATVEFESLDRELALDVLATIGVVSDVE